MPMLEWATEAQQRNLIERHAAVQRRRNLYRRGRGSPSGDVSRLGRGDPAIRRGKPPADPVRPRAGAVERCTDRSLMERDADECSERFRDNFCRDGQRTPGTLTIPGGNGKSLIRRPGPALSSPVSRAFRLFSRDVPFQGMPLFLQRLHDQGPCGRRASRTGTFQYSVGQSVSHLYRLGTFLGEREAGVFGRCDRVVRTNRENFRTGSHTGLRLRHVPLCVVRDGTSVAG